MLSRVNLIASLPKIQARCLNTGVEWRAAKNSSGKDGKRESERMKKFHDKLKTDTGPSGTPEMELDDLVLVETDPKSGEAVANREKDPTKWGDWQHGGRVSDF